MYLLESGSDYDNPQWLDTQSSSSSTLNGADLAGLSSSAAINDNLLNSQRQSRRDGSDDNFCLSINQSSVSQAENFESVYSVWVGVAR